jgi:SAM-dependent methyltransferase
MYYEDLQPRLQALFGERVTVGAGSVRIGDRSFPVVDDVIILGEIGAQDRAKKRVIESFGREWRHFPDRKAEHVKEFEDYFDLIDLSSLNGKTCADFGCGMGRWSQILLEKAAIDSLVAVDYSDAIFVARDNLRQHRNVIFIKADLETLSLPPDSFDFSFCLGVLHHIPGGIETAARNIARCSRKHLCYLYYDFEDRGRVFRAVFKLADGIRLILSPIKPEPARRVLSHVLTILAYYPFIAVSALAGKIGLSRARIPLNYYVGYGYERIRQDAYDRFFTPVEYRFSKRQINETFRRLYSEVIVSDNPPFWHFLCY